MEQLYYSPGQQATLFLEVTDGYYGHRIDSPSNPYISRIIFPDLSLAEGYPQDLVKLDTGLYYYKFYLPSGAAAVGSYLVDINYTNPIDGLLSYKAYHIAVKAPFGLYTATYF